MSIDPESGHPRRWAALGVLCLSLVVVTLDNTVLNTAIPALARSLSASTADLQWIIDAYTLVFAALLVFAGGLGTRLGQRRALIAGMVIFAAGSAGAALSDSSPELIAFRAVMGVGAAFVMPATLVTIAQIFPLRERAKAVAIWSAAAGVGVVIGPVLGGALLEHFAWGSVFWINVPLIAFAVAGIVAVVPAIPGRRGGRLDVLGAVLSTAGLAALVDMIVEAPQRGWLSTVSVLEASASVLLLAGFVGWELRVAEPMVDVRAFSRRAFTVATAALGVTFFALFGALFVFSQYLQLVHAYNPLRAGLGALPFAIALAATSATSNLTTAWLGTRTSVVLGLGVVGLALGGMSLTTVDTSFWLLASILGLMGAGMGMIMAPASLSTLSSLPREKAATASAMNSVIRELGGVLGIAVVGSVVSAGYHSRMLAGSGSGSGSGAGAGAESLDSLAARDLTSAHVVAGHLPGDLAQNLIGVANEAFTAAMDSGMRVCAAVALVGAVAALLGLPGRARTGVAPVPASPVAAPSVVASPVVAASAVSTPADVSV